MSDTFNLDQLANMSDADFMESASSMSFEQEQAEADLSDYPEVDAEDTAETDPESTEEEVDGEEEAASELDEPQDEELDDATEEEAEEDDPDSEESEEDLDDEEVEKSESELLLEQLFSPFAANGTQIKVDTVDEAIELMKMGANYHKKMHTLKPHLRFLKTLEKNELLNEDKLNFLIDLSKGDKKAISKLLSDGSIDPLDINTEESNEYSPVKHTVSEESINLDEVLERIQDTPTFKDTMDVLTNQWDRSSKDKLVANPSRIEVLNAHKASGLFDRINAEVQKARMLGQLSSTVSDIDAYEQIGLRMMQQEQQTPPANVNVPKQKKSATPADKKRLATPKSKKRDQSPKPKVGSIESLAELSDDDFLKVSSKYF